jgi:hypothetical protein
MRRRIVSISIASMLVAALACASEPGFERIIYRDYRILQKDAYAAFQNKDYPRALTLLERVACGGDKTSQFELGGMYLLGQGTRPDALKAYAWFRVAAESGEIEYRQAADKLAAAIPPIHREAAETLARDTLERYGLKATHMTCVKESALGSRMPRLECRPVVEMMTGFMDLKECEE